MRANLLVAQSGGPSAAINATVSGVAEFGLVSNNVDKILGAVNGIQGVLNENFIELCDVLSSPRNMQLLCQTPAAALGSCRLKLADVDKDETIYEKIVSIFRKHNIGYFVYIGGNDSMDTVRKLSLYIEKKGIEDIKVMGAPKTIDNDLSLTDHCPGFGSAAKYIATTFTELERDRAVYNDQSITVVEVMGRNAGWLTAASILAKENGGHGPQLIYLCEKPLSKEKFIEDVKREMKKSLHVIIAVSEGVKDEDGRYLSESVQSGDEDVFGHKYISGVANVLGDIIRENISGAKVRAIELNLMQRCSARNASLTDIYESRMLGQKAASCAIEGKTGRMAAVERISNNPYKVRYIDVDVAKVANLEKKVPLEWITEDGCQVTDEMLEYLRPLIQGEVNMTFINGTPEHIRLY